jgi:hypothetical protein
MLVCSCNEDQRACILRQGRLRFLWGRAMCQASGQTAVSPYKPTVVSF